MAIKFAVIMSNMNVACPGPENVVDVPHPVAAVQVLRVPAVRRRHLRHRPIPVLVPRGRVHSLGLDPRRDLESHPRNEERGNISSCGHQDTMSLRNS